MHLSQQLDRASRDGNLENVVRFLIDIFHLNPVSRTMSAGGRVEPPPERVCGFPVSPRYLPTPPSRAEEPGVYGGVAHAR